MTSSNAAATSSNPSSIDIGPAAADLSAADKHAHEVLAALAHELRNSLAAFTSSLPLLEQHPARDEGERVAREIVRRQTAQLRQLADTLVAARKSGAAAGNMESSVEASLPAERQKRAAAAEETRPAQPATTAGAKRRVLIIEDNADVQLMLKTLVEFWGHEVWVASDGHAGLRAIERVKPDIALIDIDLPSVNGYEMARRLTAHPLRRRPYLVAVTGYSAPEQKEQALRSGFDLHLAKPAEPTQLSELISNCPSRSQPV